MLFMDTKQHNKPHVHVYYGDFEAAVGIDGELLAGSLPKKQLKMVAGWLAFHEEEATVLRGGMILITFSTGEQRLFDTTLLTGTAFKPLKDEKVLSDFTIFHGVMTWRNGDIDIAPETMYADSYPYTAKDASVAVG